MADCVMCLDARRETTLAPCGHRALCGSCTSLLLSARARGQQPLCPICRKPVESYITREFHA
jgi:hypothetical protein